MYFTRSSGIVVHYLNKYWVFPVYKIGRGHAPICLSGLMSSAVVLAVPHIVQLSQLRVEIF